jgi:hypothetical protein
MNQRIQLFILLSGLIVSPCSASLQKPSDGQFINYIHILFEWDQEPDAEKYQIQVSQSESFDSILFSDTTDLTLFIDQEHIDWDENYFWRIRALNENDVPGPWIDVSVFHTMASKFPNTDVEIIQDEMIQDGFTVFGGAFPALQSGLIDKVGNEIWNDGDGQFMLVHVNEFGNIYGLSTLDSPNNNGIRTNADMEILRSVMNSDVDFHEFKQMPNRNYMGLVAVDTLGPIPANHDMTEQFQNLGYAADGVTNEFPWIGQKLVEWNEDHEIVWSWNPFDHFTMEDYDHHGFTWTQAYQESAYDWTHANSFFYDENESVIYISFRHLSRISKIDYETGNVIWNMGLPEPYMATGNNQICTDLLFSFQHHIQKLENGNLLFLDNGNISDQLFGYDDPISRVLELEVIGDTTCDVVWEYVMPPNLFGTGSGSVQRLGNGNTLVYTAGNGLGVPEATIMEVAPAQYMVWKYVSEQNESWYRAHRIPAIHSSAFSVTVDNYKTTEIDGNQIEGVLFSDSANFVKFQIHNKSGYDQPFYYDLIDSLGWIDLFVNDTIMIENGETFEFLHNLNIGNVSTENRLQLIVAPIHHPEDEKVLRFMFYKVDDPLSTKEIPSEFKLYYPYPNPFNPEITFSFELTKRSNIDLTIYDVLGCKVKSFNQIHLQSGRHKLNWKASDEPGKMVSAGIYLYEFKIGTETQIGKVIYLK